MCPVQTREQGRAGHSISDRESGRCLQHTPKSAKQSGKEPRCCMRLTHKLPCHTEMVLGEKEWASLKPEEEIAQKEKKNLTAWKPI